MWITVLGLAIAVNFEPIRLGLITVALGRPRPALQLLAFLSGSFLMSMTAGLMVLFVVRPGLLGRPEFSNAKGTNRVRRARAPRSRGVGQQGSARPVLAVPEVAMAGAGGPPPQAGSRTVEFVASRVKGLVRGGSPWFSGAMGVAIALPSIDYLALLVLIATSGITPADQVGLLVTFVAVANTVVAIPIASLVAPAATARGSRRCGPGSTPAPGAMWRLSSRSQERYSSRSG